MTGEGRKALPATKTCPNHDLEGALLMNATPALADDAAEAADIAEESTSPAPSRTLEIITAAASLAFMVLVLVLSLNISLRSEAAPGQIDARFWPTVLSIAGILLAVAQLVLALIKPAPARDDIDSIAPGGYRLVAVTVVATVLFIVVWNIGSVIMFGYRIQLFPIAAVLLLAGLIAAYGARSWKAYVFFPIPMAMLAYVLFHVVLRIPL